MNRRVESITEIDFQAYVDDELPPARRIEVEAHICHCHHTAEAPHSPRSSTAPTR
jgi:anti-sigma factor RsiW